MKTTAKRLESQGKTEFALLFERLFPNGADLSGHKRYSYMGVIRERAAEALILRGYNDNYLWCQCRDCSKHFEIPLSSISARIFEHRPLECVSYGCTGFMLPVYKKPTVEE